MADYCVVLPGRDAYFAQLEAQLLGVQSKQNLLGVVLLRLTRLRDINRTYGYQSGDAVVTEFVARTLTLLRPCDRLYRMSDSELVLLLPELKGAAHAELALARLLEVQHEKILIGEKKIKIDFAMGLALYPLDAPSARSLTQCAQNALHQAEKAGLPWVRFDAHRTAHEPYTLDMECELQGAIDNHELSLAYQPIVCLQTGALHGVEALLRWKNEKYGEVGPESLISIAERSDLIEQITLWTFNSGLRQFNTVLKICQTARLAVNLSAAMLKNVHLVNLLGRCIKTWNYPTDRLQIEITESAVMLEPERSINTVHQLNDIGISVSIDDFGTGYSSLAYLQRLPVRELKIDKSFILGMADHQEDRNIVRAVIDLSHNFGLTVVAEGIEDVHCLDKLRAMGCDCAQGYYFCKPMALSALVRWLQAHNPRAIAV